MPRIACILAAAILFLVAVSPPVAAQSVRPVVYQLMVRTFGNANETRKAGGSMAENGCGKFNGINEAALVSLKEMGFTHLWLTGVMEQASATAHPNRPGDDPDILKGLAGSPYAIKDYFDVCPDYAEVPVDRIYEFKLLLDRAHKLGLKVLVDFVPNHVSRAYASDVKPELSFGTSDNKNTFFERNNNFYYLNARHPGGGPPLRLPTHGKPGCDGQFEVEKEFGRVTGNNAITWAPVDGDWYETIKLNYGHDFTRGRDTSHLPGPETPPEEVPDTWRKMDGILAYWQKLGVDGFRVDMAHMVPMPFWSWSIQRARSRDGEVFFMAEAYDNDPAKLTDGNVLEALLASGFDAVYDDASYDVLHGIYTGPKWANDLNVLANDDAPLFHRSLRYSENHDEVRLANPKEWGGHGAAVGAPVTALLFALGRGPIMVYHGQEVGEPALGAEGYGGDDGRTSIFDYWSLPELQKWSNGGRYDGQRLDAAQKARRDWYGRLLRALNRPAFTFGRFYGLNHANADNPDFGRVDGEAASGHWLYAFLRSDPVSKASALVVVNLHPTRPMENVRVRMPAHAMEWMNHSGLELKAGCLLRPDIKVQAPAGELSNRGVALPPLPPGGVFLLELE